MTPTFGDPNYTCGKVLVVDDQEPNRMLLRDQLQAQGHQVIEAGDGRQAIELATSQSPDVILLDVMMPVMNGFEACRSLKSSPATAHIPVLMVTALTEREERLQGMQAGANDFLTKPIDFMDIVLRVRNAIQAKRLFDQVQANLEKFQALERLRDRINTLVLRELRTPLTGVIPGLRTLQTNASARDPELGRALDEVIRELLAVGQSMQTVLDLSPARISPAMATAA